MGQKGQILIPKIFREEYGIREGEEIAMEPREEGLLLKGRPSKEDAISSLRDHLAKLKSLGISGSKLGELKETYQEIEYER
ncbi:MAG: AbrB/MazE/SpoVT family DNA-binding domain-containing protein [Nitrososphaerales archaeon]